MFQWCFNDVALVSKECFKCFETEGSNVFQASFKLVSSKFQTCLKNVSKGIPGSLKCVSIEFQGWSKDF